VNRIGKIRGAIGLYFAIDELEGAIRVGEHRLRHDGRPQTRRKRPRASSDADEQRFDDRSLALLQ
jgi:hypothetical protein